MSVVVLAIVVVIVAQKILNLLVEVQLLSARRKDKTTSQNLTTNSKKMNRRMLQKIDQKQINHWIHPTHYYYNLIKIKYKKMAASVVMMKKNIQIWRYRIVLNSAVAAAMSSGVHSFSKYRKQVPEIKTSL